MIPLLTVGISINTLSEKRLGVYKLIFLHLARLQTTFPHEISFSNVRTSQILELNLNSVFIAYQVLFTPAI